MRKRNVPGPVDIATISEIVYVDAESSIGIIIPALWGLPSRSGEEEARPMATSPQRDARNVFVFGDLLLDHLIPVRSFDPASRFGQRAQRARGHTLHVSEYVPRSEAETQNERLRIGLQRQNFAGGAAIAARLIAAHANGGRTCLWGLTGRSNWGSFHDLLEISQQFDNAQSPITNYASHDEARRLNTVVMIVQSPRPPTLNNEYKQREYQIFDINTHRATEAESAAAFEYLKHEARSRVHAIMFSDLDLDAISVGLVRAVGNYAHLKEIPVIVDTRSDWDKYQDIEVSCAVFNLDEWCDVVGESDNFGDWLETAGDRDRLIAMATLSHRYMPRVKNFVINCCDYRTDSYRCTVLVEVLEDRRANRTGFSALLPDDDVEIAEVTSGGARPGHDAWAVLSTYSAQPLATGEVLAWRIHIKPLDLRISQLGVRRVFSAAIANEIAYLGRPLNYASRTVVEAIKSAGCVLQCYMDPRFSVWHRVPNRQTMDWYKIAVKMTDAINIQEPVHISGGDLLLPRADANTVDLRNYTIYNSVLVSQDSMYRRTISRLVEFVVGGIRDRWNKHSRDFKSAAVLSGSGGMGKDQIIDIVTKQAKDVELAVCLGLACPRARKIEVVLQEVRREWEKFKKEAQPRGLLIIVNEAFSDAQLGRLLRGNQGKVFLEAIKTLDGVTRFLFVDADYVELREKNRVQVGQFTNRVGEFFLPSLMDRKPDIPFIFARACFDELFGDPNQKSNDVSDKILTIEAAALVRVINWVLGDDEQPDSAYKREQQNSRGREMIDHAVTAAQNARPRISRRIVTVTTQHLPEPVRDTRVRDLPRGEGINFVWSTRDPGEPR